GSAVDLVELERLAAVTGRHHLGERGGQGGLAVVDVTDGSDIDDGLAHDSLSFLLRAGRLAMFAPPPGARTSARPSSARPENESGPGATQSRGPAFALLTLLR